MPAHGYYWTAHWRALRSAALARDGCRCTVAGCNAAAAVVDHIVTRPRVAVPCALDRLDNLRSLCRRHDLELKERRGRRPVRTRIAVGADGFPDG